MYNKIIIKEKKYCIYLKER